MEWNRTLFTSDPLPGNESYHEAATGRAAPTSPIRKIHRTETFRMRSPGTPKSNRYIKIGEKTSLWRTGDPKRVYLIFYFRAFLLERILHVQMRLDINGISSAQSCSTEGPSALVRVTVRPSPLMSNDPALLLSSEETFQARLQQISQLPWDVESRLRGTHIGRLGDPHTERCWGNWETILQQKGVSSTSNRGGFMWKWGAATKKESCGSVKTLNQV